MITSNERQSVGNGYLSVGEFYGLSTDTKPTNTANGSTFFEMDTGKMYRYNFSAHTWAQTTHYGNTGGFGPAPSGGGGSGGGVLVCTMDFTTGALDHTLQEILDAPFVVAKLEMDAGGSTVIAWAPLVFKSPWYDPEAETLGTALYFVQYNTHEGESVTYDLVGIVFHATNPTDYPVLFDRDDGGDDSGGGGDDTQQA